MIRTQEITVNMGPQHPSTHGVFRCVLTLDGEMVTGVTNHTGYLHRGLEKLAEARTYGQFIPYTDRMDYVAAILNELSYVQTVEKLFPELEIPERAEYIRVIVGELQRLSSHAIYVGCYALDLAGFTGWMYCFRDREHMLDLIEELGGNRHTPNYMRVGGVAGDLTDGWLERLDKLMDMLPAAIDEYDGLITGNEILQMRSIGTGILKKEDAINFGITGPNLRAAGVDWDLRRDEPYGIYDRFEFDVPVYDVCDNYNRYKARVFEMRQSIRIIKQAMRDIPDGPVMAKVPKVLKPAPGEAYHRIEGSKGHVGFYIVSDGSTKPYRTRIYSPSFVNLGALYKMAVGTPLMDTVATLASVDIVLGEVDR